MDLIYLTKRELIRRRFSPRTVDSYLFCLKNFLKWVKKEPRTITKLDIKNYLYYLVEEGKADSTLNVNLQAIKFSLEYVLNKRNVFVDLPCAKVSKRLPTFLTKEETISLLNSIENKKHKLLISLMYSAGLRVSELVNLKKQDLVLSENYGWVRNGKGSKDRLFVIAECLKQDLYELIQMKNDSDYLFIGQKGHYSQRSVQEIVKKATKKAKIKKNIHPHTLRHSFATHIIENGYDVHRLQGLLAHSSPNTTMMYVHMAPKKAINVESPLDSLNR